MRPPTTLKGQISTLPLKQNSLGWSPLWSGGKGNVSQASYLSVLFQYPYSVEMNFKRMVWDPRKGFVIPSHSFVYSGVLTCTANVNGSVFTSYYLAQRLGEWILWAKEWPQCFYSIAKPLGIISWLASIISDISNWYVSVASPSWNAKSKLTLPLFFLFNRTWIWSTLGFEKLPSVEVVQNRSILFKPHQGFVCLDWAIFTLKQLLV